MMVFIMLLAVLGFLWFLDEITTKLDIDKYGLSVERNPIIKFLYKRGFKYITEFKAISFVIFIIISYALFSAHKLFFYIFVLFLIMAYLVVNIKNLKILKLK